MLLAKEHFQPQKTSDQLPKIADFPIKQRTVKGRALVILKKICGLYITEKELFHEIR